LELVWIATEVEPNVARRVFAAMLLGAALVGLALGASPALCHEDEECRTNAQHHAVVNCGCSCHMAAVVPIPVVPQLATVQLPAALAVSGCAPAVFLNRPERPPRG
jgi:hypothetical protein